MADEDDFGELKRRMKRLEGIIAILLVDPQEADADLREYLLYRFARPDYPDNDFWFELLRHIRRLPFAPRWSQLSDRIERLESTYDANATNQEKVLGRLNRLESDQSELQQESHRWLVLQSLGVSLAEVPLPRFVQVRVRLATDNDNTISAVADSIKRVLKAFGFVVSDDFPERRGSWIKDFFAKSKDALSQKEVQDRLSQLEHAARLHGTGKIQSEIDKNKADAVATLLKALPNDSDAAMQVGSVLMIRICNDKDRCSTHVRTLTDREMILLEKHQDLLLTPRDLLAKLSEASSQDTEKPARLIQLDGE